MRALSLCATALVLSTTLLAGAPQTGGTARPRATRPPAAPQARKPTPARPARREAPVPFQVGETLTFDVGWSNYLVAGSATSRVVEKRASYGSTAYYIVAEGRPIPLIARFYNVFYKMDSLLDSFSTLSQRTSLYQEERGLRRYVATTFDRRARKATFESDAEPAMNETFPVPQNVQDGLATLYTLRSRSFKAGDHISVPVADEGMLYTASFDVTGPEPLRVPLGTMDAWNLRVTILDASNQPVGRNVAAWISTDARHLPLKLQADLPVGNFALALRSAQ